jgi:hypothetical protein
VILLFALLQIAQPVESDIVVIGQRLQSIAAIVGKDAHGRFTCSLSASSGNVRLDANLCKTASQCVAKGAATPEAVSACIDARKPALLDQLRRELGEAA